MAAIAVAAVLVALAALAARPDQPGSSAGSPLAGGTAGVENQAGVHAAAACNLGTRAEQAAEATVVDERARYAAAVLLLDRAIIESARAAVSDTGLGELDVALQAAHTAAHEGDHDGWRGALRRAHAKCRLVLG